MRIRYLTKFTKLVYGVWAAVSMCVGLALMYSSASAGVILLLVAGDCQGCCVNSPVVISGRGSGGPQSR